MRYFVEVLVNQEPGGSMTRTRRDGIRIELADFVQAHPKGWGHDDWQSFIDGLQRRGFNVDDADSIGLALEKERVRRHLSEVSGLGPKRLEALIDRFPRLWDLENASVEDLASIPTIPRSIAQTLHETLHWT
jgi:hypothetical protein